MPGEEKSDLVRMARLSPQTALLGVLLLGGGFGGFHGSAKLDQSLEVARETQGSVKELKTDVQKLTSSLTELKTRVEATEKLSLDTRLRALEQLGTERRLEALERDAQNGRK